MACGCNGKSPVPIIPAEERAGGLCCYACPDGARGHFVKCAISGVSIHGKEFRGLNTDEPLVVYTAKAFQSCPKGNGIDKRGRIIWNGDTYAGAPLLVRLALQSRVWRWFLGACLSGDKPLNRPTRAMEGCGCLCGVKARWLRFKRAARGV